MQNRSKNESLKIGDMILTPQGQKYEILQRINSNKKLQKQHLPSMYEHIDTFIVKRLSNKVYYILKRFLLFNNQKPVKQSIVQSPSKEKTTLKQIKSKQLFHPNLIVIQQAFFQKTQKTHKTLILIEEYCQQGDLSYFVKYESKRCSKEGKKETFSEKVIAKWLLQILLALEHLHFNKSTHQILTPNNIFLTPLGNLKLNEYYFLNSLIAVKQTKKTKENASPIVEGYQPLVNQKKFKVNEKKDIFDFGILISYLCNSKTFKESKKQDKNKNFVNLPDSYSKELNQIYCSCINVKKTGIQVKDILRTPYFLSVMRQFIIDKKLNASMFERIPIKKYLIHKKSINSKPQSSKLLKKQEKNDKQTIQVKLPRIDKLSKQPEAKKSNTKTEKTQNKELYEAQLKKAMRASLEKLKNKLDKKQKESKVRKLSIDKKQGKQLQRKGSKEKPKLLIPIPSKEPSKYTLKPPPSLPKNKKGDSKTIQSPQNENRKQVRSSRQQARSTEKQKRQRISRSQSVSPKKTQQSNKKFQLTPETTFGKKVSDSNNQAQSPSINIIQPIPGVQNEGENEDSKTIELQKISQNLAKIFSDLKIRQDDDQELSFELDQQQQEELRLTLKQQKQGVSSEQNLMKTYKWKFQEIVNQLQEKYQPNLQTILEKTTQWDSNDFLVNQELLKRLRLQQEEQGNQQITFGG